MTRAVYLESIKPILSYIVSLACSLGLAWLLCLARRRGGTGPVARATGKIPGPANLKPKPAAQEKKNIRTSQPIFPHPQTGPPFLSTLSGPLPPLTRICCLSAINTRLAIRPWLASTFTSHHRSPPLTCRTNASWSRCSCRSWTVGCHPHLCSITNRQQHMPTTAKSPPR
jgi:hypothetical protein